MASLRRTGEVCSTDDTAQRKLVPTFADRGIIGALGGLIGLGGSEFRLPLLIGIFNFAALGAVILNKAMSLVVGASALPFRTATVPFNEIGSNWRIAVNLRPEASLRVVRRWMGDPSEVRDIV